MRTGPNRLSPKLSDPKSSVYWVFWAVESARKWRTSHRKCSTVRWKAKFFTFVFSFFTNHCKTWYSADIIHWLFTILRYANLKCASLTEKRQSIRQRFDMCPRQAWRNAGKLERSWTRSVCILLSFHHGWSSTVPLHFHKTYHSMLEVSSRVSLNGILNRYLVKLFLAFPETSRKVF